jgi:hypothetical protein
MPDVSENAASTAEQPGRKKYDRDVSTIQFPYADLDDAISVARTILDLGGHPAPRDAIAAKMGLSAGSGNFTIKIGAARQFGLIETVAGKYQLTQLAHSILDSDEERVRAAKVDAFLNVELYARVYEDFRGKLLPPRPHGLEQAFGAYGVAPKQKDKARQVFDRSARQAGFYASGQDRLVAPVVAMRGPAPSAEKNPAGASERVASGQYSFNEEDAAKKPRHQIIEGLFQTLPPKGDTWSLEEAVEWLEAAAANFRIVYKIKGTITVTAKPPQSE